MTGNGLPCLARFKIRWLHPRTLGWLLINGGGQGSTCPAEPRPVPSSLTPCYMAVVRSNRVGQAARFKVCVTELTTSTR